MYYIYTHYVYTYYVYMSIWSRKAQTLIGPACMFCCVRLLLLLLVPKI